MKGSDVGGHAIFHSSGSTLDYLVRVQLQDGGGGRVYIFCIWDLVIDRVLPCSFQAKNICDMKSKTIHKFQPWIPLIAHKFDGFQNFV